MSNRNKMIDKLRNPDFSYRYSHLIIIYMFLIIMVIAVSMFNKNFSKPVNLKNIIDTAFPLIMAAFGQTIVILIGGIDLSIGGMIALCNCASIAIMTHYKGTDGVVIALIATLLLGLLCGAINGIFITKGRLPSIIVTIASTAIFSGVALFVMPTPGGAANMKFAKMVNGYFLGLPVSLYLIVIFAIILRFITNSTSYGKALRAVGGNESAAYSTGIVVWKVKFLTYVIAGFFCAIAGIFLGARMYSADPNIGTTFSMYSITAAVVGGTMLTGAVGDVLGTTAGALIIYIINNVLNLIGVSSYYQYVLQGLILIIALTISAIKSRRS